MRIQIQQVRDLWGSYYKIPFPVKSDSVSITNRLVKRIAKINGVKGGIHVKMLPLSLDEKNSAVIIGVLLGGFLELTCPIELETVLKLSM